MGVSIKATNSTFTFDCGSGGFFNLRKNIALALDPEFGSLYGKLIYIYSEEDFEVFEWVTTLMAARKQLDSDVLDFLFQSDAEGSVSYQTCKKIYLLIRDIDFGEKGFRYGICQHNDYEEFKEFLLECYRHRRKMWWR